MSNDEGRPVAPHRSGGGHWVGPTREETPNMAELIANVAAPADGLPEELPERLREPKRMSIFNAALEDDQTAIMSRDYDELLAKYDTLRAKAQELSNINLEIGLRLADALEQLERERDYIKRMDAIIDDENVARSCINPLEDLRNAIRGLKSALAAALEREKAYSSKHAQEAIELFIEYRDKHGKSEQDAKYCVMCEFDDAALSQGGGKE